MSVVNKNFRLRQETVDQLLKIQGIYEEESKGFRIPGKKYSQAETIAYIIEKEYNHLLDPKDETAATKSKKLNNNIESLLQDGKPRRG